MDTTTDTIMERVRRGAMLLDMEVPGWAGKINGDELDLNDCVSCVLGQIYGWYATGHGRLGLDDTLGRAAHGFTFCGCDSKIRDWSALAAAWLVEIRARLAPEPDEAIGARNCPELAALVP
jgi:hypothetical protein